MLEPIVRRANQLRRAIRLSVATVGVSHVLFGLLGFFIISYSLDFFLPDHLDFFQRVLLLLLAVGAVGFLAVRYAVLPQLGHYSVDSLVLALERANPDLNDEMISSLQLDRRLAVGDTSMSHWMARLVIDSGLARSQQVDPLGPINRSRVNALGGSGLACVVLLTVAFAVGPMQTWTWFGRNVLLQPWQYEMRTQLTLCVHREGEDYEPVEPGEEIRVARGENLLLEIRADMSKVVPDRTYIRYRFAGGASGELAKEPMKQQGPLSGLYRFSFSKMAEPMDLTIRGGDYQPPEGRAWWHVKVLEPPVVTSLRLDCKFPPYTRLQDKTFDSSKSAAQLANLKLPVGTWIHLTGRTTKPIVQAAVVSVTREDVVGQRGDGQIPDRLAMGESIVQIDPPAPEFSRDICLVKGGELLIELLDDEGVRNQLAAQLKIIAAVDEKPAVGARLTGVSQIVTPIATIPLLLKLSDDYGVRAVALAAECTGKKPYDLHQVSQLVDERGQPVAFGGPKVEGLYRWDISFLDTKPGDFLQFKVQATDNEVLMANPVPAEGSEPRLPILDGANVGDSDTISLKIVTAQELLNKLISDQIEITEEFSALLEQQTNFRLSVTELKGKLANQSAVSGQLATDLKDVRSGQQNVPKDLNSIAERLLAVAEEMVNNRIDVPGELVTLRDRLAAPIQALAASHAMDAANDLVEAEKETDAGKRDAIFNNCLARQNLTIQEMTRLYEIMRKKATLDQIRQGLIVLLGTEKEIYKVTKDMYDEFLRGLLGPGGGEIN